jgi:hypothetical protein
VAGLGAASTDGGGGTDADGDKGVDGAPLAVSPEIPVE